MITRTGSVSGLTGSLNLLPSVHTGGAATATSNSLHERGSYHNGTTASGSSMNNQPVGTKSMDGSAAFANPLGSSNQQHSLIPPPQGTLVGSAHTSGSKPNLTPPLPQLTFPQPSPNLIPLWAYRYPHTASNSCN